MYQFDINIAVAPNVLVGQCLYGRTPAERPPSPTTIPLIRPYFVCRTLFSVCTIPDQRPSLRRDQQPGQMGFSPSRTTTSPTVYFQESRVAVQHPFPIMYYHNVVPRHLSSNSIDLNFIWATTLQRRSQIDVASLRCCQPTGAQPHL